MSTRRSHLARGARLGLPVLALLGLGLAGCGEPAPVEPAAPVPAPSSSTPSSPAPSKSPAAPAVDPGRSTSGSDGLTVRYLDGGSVKTVHVEDFPR